MGVWRKANSYALDGCATASGKSAKKLREPTIAPLDKVRQTESGKGLPIGK
jgi:hypothetical protein